jgi:hypothetical protein
MATTAKLKFSGSVSAHNPVLQEGHWESDPHMQGQWINKQWSTVCLLIDNDRPPNIEVRIHVGLRSLRLVPMNHAPAATKLTIHVWIVSYYRKQSGRGKEEGRVGKGTINCWFLATL